MNVVAIIQARMGSSRFPGKVLQHLAGKPLLWHITSRLRQCTMLNQIVLATSNNPADDPLEEFAKEEGLVVIRGDELNVLQRYLKAARDTNADVIVRVTGDAPLVDSVTIDKSIQTLIATGVDYCVGNPETPSLHEGFSPFTRNALERLAKEAGDDPVAKEHVTAYFKVHPDFVATQFIDADPLLYIEGVKLSVDTPADLSFLEELYKRLGDDPGMASFQDVVTLLKQEPALLSLNTHVKKKGFSVNGIKVLVRCDAGHKVGLGHMVRCVALGDELREVYASGVVFAMMEDDEGMKMVRERGFLVETNKAYESEVDWLSTLVDIHKPNVMILDVRTSLSKDDLLKLKKQGVLIVVIDDSTDRRLVADLVLCHPVPQVADMKWEGFAGELLCGWEWILLRRQFKDVYRQSLLRGNSAILPGSRLRILVSMGGSDPKHATLKVIHALKGLYNKIHLIVIVGALNADKNVIKEHLQQSNSSYEIHEDVNDMVDLMNKADLAITCFSMTAYELAAAGVPGLFICLTQSDSESACSLVERGCGLNLGLITHVQEKDIRYSVETLLEYSQKLIDMKCKLSGLIDGRGTERFARKIIDKYNSSYVHNNENNNTHVVVFKNGVEK